MCGGYRYLTPQGHSQIREVGLASAFAETVPLFTFGAGKCVDFVLLPSVKDVVAWASI